ncbi:peroxiredoxin, partial [Vibrio parahaemolyticus]
NADLVGRKSVIYFYPKDDTPGCTKEACEFRDLFVNVPGAQVFGVSPDDEKSHRKFIAKFGLNFRLLADTEHALAE